jgi:hypothetical protein
MTSERVPTPTFDGTYWIVAPADDPTNRTTFLNWILFQDFLNKEADGNWIIEEKNISRQLKLEFNK